MFKLVKEIKSLKGVIGFRRYHLFSMPWFHCYLHRIYQPDQDAHLHNHPWNFFGIILWGGYIEERPEGLFARKFGAVIRGKRNYFHKIKALPYGDVATSLFFTGRKTWSWGYLTAKGVIDHQEYRELKHKNQLPGRFDAKIQVLP